MRTICKKFLIALILIVLLFDFVIKPYCYAEDIGDIIAFALGTFVGVITWIPRLLAIGVAYGMDMLAAGIAFIDGTTDSSSFLDKIFVTPFDIVFGKALITDINFFNFSNISGTTVGKIREAVAKWYYFMRTVAVAILLVVLVYVGIRMALSTIAEDKAKYKKMLVDWASSLALVFLLQYIILFVITINNALVKAMASVSEVNGLEDALKDLAMQALGFTVDGIAATIVFCLFIYQSFVILFSYINRMIRVAFLIIISPLITITYSIDKMGDGKAQALNEWLKEFITSVLIQPFHCVIYMVFVSIALELVVNPGTGKNRMASSVIAVLCMLFLKDAEKILRKIFNLTGDDNAASLATGAVMASAALNKSKEIGKSARKSVNTLQRMQPIKNTKEGLSKTKDGFKALGQSITGKGSLSENYKLNRTDTIKKQEEKAERKKTTKENKQLDRIIGQNMGDLKVSDPKVKEAYKNIRKTQQDKIKAEIKSKNPGMSEQELNNATRKEMLLRARRDVAREKIKSGEYKDKSIRGVAKRGGRYIKRGYKSFKNTAVGKYIRGSLGTATGIVVGSMMLDNTNLFVAAAGGMAAAKSVGEFMDSSNSYLAEDAGREAAAIAKQDPNGEITQEDVITAHEMFKSGQSEKNLDDQQEIVKDILINPGSGFTVKDKNGKDVPMTTVDAQKIISQVSQGIMKKPDADVQKLLEQATGKTLDSLDQETQRRVQNALNAIQNTMNSIQVGKTVEKALSYGASKEGIASKIVDASKTRPLFEGIDDEVQGLYQSNNVMRHIDLESQSDDDRERSLRDIYSSLQDARVSVQRYVSEMEQLMKNIENNPNISKDKKDIQVHNIKSNIEILKNYVPNSNN